MMKKTILAAALLVMLPGCGDGNKSNGGGAAQTAKTELPADEIAATVNGIPIPKTRIKIYASAGGGGNTAAVIDNMITSELLAQEAKKAGLDKDSEIAEQLAVAEQTVLGRAYTQKFLGENPPAEEVLAARYAELRTQYEGKSEYRSSHILVEDETLAKKLHTEISADGGKFAALAKKHSVDAGSGAQGGDLGWTDPGSLVPEYGAAMAATAPGKLAEAPVKTQYGWHIIYVAEKRPISVPALDDAMRARLRQALRAEKFSEHITELRGKASIVQN